MFRHVVVISFCLIALAEGAPRAADSLTDPKTLFVSNALMRPELDAIKSQHAKDFNSALLKKIEWRVNGSSSLARLFFSLRDERGLERGVSQLQLIHAPKLLASVSPRGSKEFVFSAKYIVSSKEPETLEELDYNQAAVVQALLRPELQRIIRDFRSKARAVAEVNLSKSGFDDLHLTFLSSEIVSTRWALVIHRRRLGATIYHGPPKPAFTGELQSLDL